jgi:excisionase family DNA binding protein
MSKSRVPSPPDGLLTLAEAAAYLRVCPRTVRRYVRFGLLPGRLIGRQWRFRRKALEELYENAPSAWETAGRDEGEE